MKRAPVIHPFFFAVFPVVSLASHNVEQVDLSSLVLPAAVALGAALFLVAVTRPIFGDPAKAGVAVSSLIVLFFTFGHVQDLAKGWMIAWPRYLVPLWVALLAVAFFLLSTAKKGFRRLTAILNVAAFCAVSIPALGIAAHGLGERRGGEDAVAVAELRAGAGPPRDVYYVVLDGYARADTLADVYGYDNREFLEQLSRKGFFVAGESLSNYALTFLSLASSLNMEYVPAADAASGDRAAAYGMIENSAVMRSLRRLGYAFVHFGSGWGATERNELADVDARCGRGSELLTLLVRGTMLRPVEKHLGFLRHDARTRILCTFAELAAPHGIEGPRYVFAHVICPHPPYLFDEHGSTVPEAELTLTGDVWEQKERYLDQVRFVNEKVLRLVDDILAASEPSPIIILQADHGTASSLGDPDSGHWESPDDGMLRERMGILNAYHLPAGGDELLYERITPVNTFRVVLDFYFGAGSGLLEDRSYYSTYASPFRFVDVTSRLSR